MPLAHSVEPTLRKLGLPTRLVKGKVELEGEYVVCKEGEVLGSGQTTLLKMFGVATAEFVVGVRAYWVGRTGEVVIIDGAGEGAEMPLSEGGEEAEIPLSEGMEIDEGLDIDEEV